MKKYADVRIDVTVEFEDDGDLELEAQAIQAALDRLGIFTHHHVDSIEVVGQVRDTELPAQKGE
jgi:hypothetical protein